MKYLSHGQIESEYQNLNATEKVSVMEKAFGLKEIHPEYSRIDCIALAMDYILCLSGSGLYEKP